MQVGVEQTDDQVRKLQQNPQGNKLGNYYLYESVEDECVMCMHDFNMRVTTSVYSVMVGVI
jgi:hypothetical protein